MDRLPNTAGGVDRRETTRHQAGADLSHCRITRDDGSVSEDTCPRAGGLDQTISGDVAPDERG